MYPFTQTLMGAMITQPMTPTIQYVPYDTVSEMQIRTRIHTYAHMHAPIDGMARIFTPSADAQPPLRQEEIVLSTPEQPNGLPQGGHHVALQHTYIQTYRHTYRRAYVHTYIHACTHTHTHAAFIKTHHRRLSCRIPKSSTSSRTPSTKKWSAVSGTSIDLDCDGDVMHHY